jgi:hypothetical protein
MITIFSSEIFKVGILFIFSNLLSLLILFLSLRVGADNPDFAKPSLLPPLKKLNVDGAFNPDFAKPSLLPQLTVFCTVAETLLLE